MNNKKSTGSITIEFAEENEVAEIKDLILKVVEKNMGVRELKLDGMAPTNRRELIAKLSEYISPTLAENGYAYISDKELKEGGMDDTIKDWLTM